jgi:hypothetical protein
MKEKITISEVFVVILVTSVMFGLGYNFAKEFSEPKIKIVEKIVEKTDRTYCPEREACTPCIDEPVYDKCEFEAIAYEAIVNQRNIYGEVELRKGDIYFLTNRYFYKQEQFCVSNKSEYSGEECYESSFIIKNPRLFKPLN